MKEAYKLTLKELSPIANYGTYIFRQKPEGERSGKEEVAITDRLLGLTLYNAIVIFAGLEKLVR